MMTKRYHFDPQLYKNKLLSVFAELLQAKSLSTKKIDKILKKYPKEEGKMFRRDELVAGFDWLLHEELISVEDNLKIIRQVKLKPTRTISGVTTVTVLTKPFACPGRCIFCPNDVRMPKSYIATEPGAQRALMNRFSPYLQTYNRLKALKNIGHPTNKIELLILGGTWVYYPKKYQVWFIKECFRAMNEFGTEMYDPDTTTIEIQGELDNDYNDKLRAKVGDKPYNQLLQTAEFKQDYKKFIVDEKYKLTLDEEWAELEKHQELNANGNCRCVGLVLETRPDTIIEQEVYDLRRLGATKIQLGIQTLNNEVSDMNKRGEHREHTAKSFQLLRAGGFKIHAHMMPNLYGSNPQLDREVYKELFESIDYKPDEVKIYPTSIIKHTELHKLYEEGKYRPYEVYELIDLLADLMEMTPEYCRLTRIIRDIPSTEIEAGNKTTNLREIVEHKLERENRANPNIRAREIKSQKVTFDDLNLDIIEYKTQNTTEYFLQYITQTREIAGFLRLSIPNSQENPITGELNAAGIIREVHVYGPSLELSKGSTGEAQHLGLGTKLIEKAKEIAKQSGFNKLAVISSIGTREYYEKRGFKLEKLYQIAEV